LRFGVRLFTIESTLPDEMPKKSRGFPSAVISRLLFQSGWAIIPTEKPASQRTRPMRAVPNEGWSTYASPVTRMISNCPIPRASPSFLERGRKAGWGIMEGQ